MSEDDDEWQRKFAALFEEALEKCGPNAEKITHDVVEKLGEANERIRLRILQEIQRMLSFQEPPSRPDFDH